MAAVARRMNASATTEAVHSVALIPTTATTAPAMKDINWHRALTLAQVRLRNSCASSCSLTKNRDGKVIFISALLFDEITQQLIKTK